jgi:hypothetical protein
MTFDSDFMDHVVDPFETGMNKISSQSDPLQALALVASLASNDTESAVSSQGNGLYN